MKKHEGVWVKTVHTFCRLCHLGPRLVSSQLFHAHIQTWSKEYKVFEPDTENFGKLLSHVLLKAGRSICVREDFAISLICDQKSIKNRDSEATLHTWIHSDMEFECLESHSENFYKHKTEENKKLQNKTTSTKQYINNNWGKKNLFCEKQTFFKACAFLLLTNSRHLVWQSLSESQYLILNWVFVNLCSWQSGRLIFILTSETLFMCSP